MQNRAIYKYILPEYPRANSRTLEKDINMGTDLKIEKKGIDRKKGHRFGVCKPYHTTHQSLLIFKNIMHIILCGVKISRFLVQFQTNVKNSMMVRMLFK